MNDLIDEKNIALWNNLKEIHEIEVYETNKLYYSIITQNNKSIIYVPISNINSAGFTHELLHLFLHTRGLHVKGNLIVALNKYPKLSEKFPHDLFEHIGNCLEHQKMLPLFLSMKYNIEDFIHDYHVNKLTDAEVLNIKNLFSNKKFFRIVYYSKGLYWYIATYFSVIDDPNKNFNHEKNINKLKNLDIKLFQILENCWTDWKNVNGGEYVFILKKFVSELENWSRNKKIINNY